MSIASGVLHESSSWGAYHTIYGGPTYSASTVSGYQLGGLRGGASGVAVANSHKYDGGDYEGPRAVRWDASGNPSIELGSLGLSPWGTTNTQAFGINQVGTAVGWVEKWNDGKAVPLGIRAVRWDASGTAATELASTPSLGSYFSQAYAINNAGAIVGQASHLEKGVVPVRWDLAGSITELDTFGLAPPRGVISVHASLINELGAAAGQVEKYLDNEFIGTRAVRWDAGTTVATELDTLSFSPTGFTDSFVQAINDAGTVVGFSQKFVGQWDMGFRAVRWNAGASTITELPVPKPDPLDFNYSDALAINNAGTIVGYAGKYYLTGSFGASRAIRWDGSTLIPVELGHLGLNRSGETESIALGINEQGIIVGWSLTFDALGKNLGQRAVYWQLDGTAVDINTLVNPSSGWISLISASGITDDGWIMGRGMFDPDGPTGEDPYERLFLMNINSVPESSSAAIVLTGLICFVGRRT